MSAGCRNRSAVVILNWNGADHLLKFLPSVVRHTPAEVDILVADNGSTDRSLALLNEQFPSVKALLLHTNYGFAMGYNRALAELEYENYILLNSDVEVGEGWCAPLISALDSDPTLGAVGSKLRSYAERSKFEYAGASGGFIDILGYPFARGRVLQSLEQDHGQYDDKREVFWVSGAAFAIRAERFREMGGFDEDFFAHMEEIDLCWRLQIAGYRNMILPQSVVYHLGGGTLSSTSPRKVMLNHRNNLSMLYKCAPTWQRILVAVVRPPLDFLAALSYLAKGQVASFLAVGRAYLDFILWHRALAKKRKKIRGSRKRESSQIYRGSILFAYILGRRNFSDL
ncbi:MAG: glycosyltransferase family 2 protein [Rikenellaceae bacterium]